MIRNENCASLARAVRSANRRNPCIEVVRGESGSFVPTRPHVEGGTALGLETVPVRYLPENGAYFGGLARVVFRETVPSTGAGTLAQRPSTQAGRVAAQRGVTNGQPSAR